jgi:hypothetical protein
MSPKPERSRPAGRSPLKANIETINTGAQAAPAPPTTSSPEPQAPPSPPMRISDETRPVTVKLSSSVIGKAKSAVLQTSGKPGGHRSFAGLVQAAVEREVQRLAEEFNEGQPYESHQGEFRRGRPFS